MQKPTNHVDLKKKTELLTFLFPHGEDRNKINGFKARCDRLIIEILDIAEPLSTHGMTKNRVTALLRCPEVLTYFEKHDKAIDCAKQITRDCLQILSTCYSFLGDAVNAVETSSI